MVEKGHGRTQKKGEPVLELAPGDAVYVAPNVMHWHGAAPGESMTQLTMGFGGPADWRDEVSEKDYSGKATNVTPR